MSRHYYICSAGKPGDGYDDENFERCETFNGHFMHKDTPNKGCFDRVNPSDIIILKYKDVLVAYGEVTGKEYPKMMISLGEWNWENFCEKNGCGKTVMTIIRGVSKYGVSYETIDAGPYDTIKEN